MHLIKSRHTDLQPAVARSVAEHPREVRLPPAALPVPAPSGLGAAKKRSTGRKQWALH